MIINYRIAGRAVLCAALAVFVAPVRAASFTYQDISDPNAMSTRPRGINSAGVISGQTSGGTVGVSTFVLSGGNFDHYLPLNAAYAYIGKISDSGVVAGQIAVQTGPGVYRYDGFTMLNGVATAVDVPAAESTQAWEVNSSGVVAGMYRTPSRTYGFLYNSGTFTQVDGPAGSISAVLSGINNVGTAVGYYATSGGNHGLIRAADGTLQTLDVPNSTSTVITGINNLGYMVGYTSGTFCSETGYAACGFFYDGGSFSVVAVPGRYTLAYDLNDFNQIVGEYSGPGGNSVGFLATPPVPEPGTFALLSGCVGALALARRGRLGQRG